MQASADKKVKNFSQPKIRVLGMGGTIAGLAPDPEVPERYDAAQRSVTDLLKEVGQSQGLPETALLKGLEIESWQVAQIDSKDLAPGHWQALLKALWEALSDPLVVGVVITHGTDTLEESASFLDEVLNRVGGPVGKPVVLTCAMRPGNALDADGPQNLADALLLASSMETQARGVWVVCAGQAHAAKWVRKVHPQRLNAFDSGEELVVAQVQETPGGQGRQWVWSSLIMEQTIGSVKKIEEDRARLTLLTTDPVDWPKVGILTHHAGSEAWEVEALVSAGAQGLVVACTGNGTVSGVWLAALLRAQEQGVVLRLTTRCAQGRLTQVPSGLSNAVGENALTEVTPAKARVRLQLSLLLG